MKSTSETLPSGKMIVCYYDDADRLERVVHRYGTQICFMRTESPDGSASEHYMVKGRPVDAKNYAKNAESYPDMPPPSVRDDHTRKRDRAIAEEHALWVENFDKHEKRPASGSKIDKECAALMAKALPGEGRVWLSKKIIVGEASASRSRKMLRALYDAGAKAVYLLGSKDARAEPTCVDGMVVELPASASERRQVLIECDLLSRMSGETGYYDDGQRFTEVRF